MDEAFWKSSVSNSNRLNVNFWFYEIWREKSMNIRYMIQYQRHLINIDIENIAMTHPHTAPMVCH